MSDLLSWARVVLDDVGLQDWKIKEAGATAINVDKKEIRIRTKQRQRHVHIGDDISQTWVADNQSIEIAYAIARAKGCGRSLGVSIVRETFFQIVNKHFVRRTHP